MKTLEFTEGKQKLEKEINDLKLLLEEKERELEDFVKEQNNHNLSNEDVNRYSRQIFVPQIGVKGQEKLKGSSVLIIGCGGLGCPSSQYLVGCGIGHIGLVDYDAVELNNLHRQLLHGESDIGLPKVDSAENALKRLNGSLKVSKYGVQLDSTNAAEIIREFDVVVDASDNVATRYLVSDACVLLGKPLVSGSAVQMEGQLTVYNYKDGPCYRCIFPVPPPPESVSNCGDAGVLGPVPGVIGVLQAIQVVHILVGSAGVLSSKLLLFDGSDTVFRTMRLRPKKSDCVICGEAPTIQTLIDYEQFCGAPANDKSLGISLLSQEERITPKEMYKIISETTPHVLIDVRSPEQFSICRLPGSLNVPMNLLHSEKTKSTISGLLKDVKKSVYVVCRRGNDSQRAVKKLQEIFSGEDVIFKDIEGGLHKWAETIDNTFPVY